MRYILLNGPKRSGKNTAAEAIRRHFHGVAVIGFSHHLKRFTHSIYLGRQGWDLDPDAFDANKEHPQELLGGMSWRQAYIHYSEKVIKPLHGKEWFGDQLVRAAHETGSAMIAVPDSGFREEAERVVRDAGARNVLLARLHREGHDFAGDSRGYVDLSDLGVADYDLVNTTGERESMERHAVDIVASWIASAKC